MNMRNVWYKTYMSGASGCLKLRVGIETRIKQANDEYELVLLNITVLR